MAVTSHDYDEAYFVGGTKSNYVDYRQLEATIEEGFMPVVRRYADSVRTRRGTNNTSYLDIGCAMGFYVERLAKLGWDAHGVDISEYAVAEGRRRGVSNLRVASANELPFAAGTFDFVTAVDVIEHLDQVDARSMVGETLRVLRPGGAFFIATPNFLTNAHWNVFTPGFEDKDSTHINYQSVESLREQLADFEQCYIYGDTPFRQQFSAFEVTGLARRFPFKLPGVARLAHYSSWKLLGRSVEYSSYLHALALK
jgi:2-polyprenyl-3-methyl-5-hydroxy-6-metoxy-1,4-benzoquinol methylase